MRRKLLALLICALISLLLTGYFLVSRYAMVYPAESETLRRETTFFNFLRDQELRVGDYFMRMRGVLPDHSPLVFLNIDDSTLAELGRWPWATREPFARILAATRAADQLFFDVLFCEPGSGAGGRLLDWKLTRTAAKNLNVHFPFYFNNQYLGVSDLKNALEKNKSLVDRILTALDAEPVLKRGLLSQPQYIVKAVAEKTGIAAESFTPEVLTLVQDRLQETLCSKALEFLKTRGYSGETQQSFLEGDATSPAYRIICDDLIATGLFDEGLVRRTSRRLLVDHLTALILRGGRTAGSLTEAALEENPFAPEIATTPTIDEQHDFYFFTSDDQHHGYPEVERRLSREALLNRGLPAPDAAASLLTTDQPTPPHLWYLEAGVTPSFVVVHPDPDGVVRSYPMILLWEGRFFPSAPLALALKHWQVKFEDVQVEFGKELRIPTRGSCGTVVIPIDAQGQMRINFPGPWQKDGFEQVPFSSVLQREFDPVQGVFKEGFSAEARLRQEGLKDKIVFVGLTATGTTDFNPTAIEGRMPMVGSVAAALDTLLMARPLEAQPVFRRDLFLALGMLAGIAIVVYFCRPLWAFIGLTGLFGLFLIGSYFYFLKTGATIGVFHILTSGALSSLVFLGGFWLLVARQERIVSQMFSTCVSPQVAQELVKNPEKLRLDGETVQATVYFSDLAGFTSISEHYKNDPSQLVRLIIEYFSVMSETIMTRDGFLDKFQGDSIMAVFGVPFQKPDDPIQACASAVENGEKLNRMRQDFQQRGLPSQFHQRIGINTGPMIWGTVGAKLSDGRDRLNPTVMGDNVNLGARLEGVNKFYHTEICIAGSTYDLVKDRFDARFLDLIAVKGKKEGVAIYELLGEKNRVTPERMTTRGYYEEAIRLYLKRDFEKAAQIFYALHRKYSDGPSQTLFERCQLFRVQPPPPEWNGVHTFTEK